MFQLTLPIVSASSTVNNNLLPPSNLSIQLITPSDIKLIWSPVYEATGYNVYGIIDGQLKVLSTTTSSSYTFNDLPEGSYTYVVSTLSAEGESGPGAPASVDVVYPNMNEPVSLNYKIQNGNDVVLSWEDTQYAQSYNIYKITDGDKTLLTSVTESTYTIINAPAGAYTYAVSAVNSLYGESSPSISTQVQVTYPTMTAPSNLTYTLSNGNDVSLKWNAANYATNYKVYQIVDGQKSLISTVGDKSINLTSMPEGDYVYEVYSYSDRFGESQEGSQISFTITLSKMEAPNNLTYTIANGNDIALRWDSVSLATGYKVYQIIDGERILKSTIAGTSVNYTNMPGGNYVYVVHSYSTLYGESKDGSLSSFNLTLPIMESPAGLSYSITNGNDIKLMWEAVSFASYYKVFQIVDGQKIFKSTIAGTTASYYNMASGDYVYEIHSYSNRFGESQVGANITFTLIHPVMEPPTDVIQIIKNATDFSLSWTTAPFANSYKVYQIIDGQKIFKNTVINPTVLYSKMAPGVYNFEIHSYSSRFGESSDGASISVTLNGQVMEAPADLTYTINNGNDVNLKWTAAQYATGYKIYQVIDEQPVYQKTVTSTYVNFFNIPSGEYNYIVKSYSTLLGESPTGAEISLSIVFPTMEAPDNLAYTIRSGNDIVLSWARVEYANNYKVYELIDEQLVLKTTVSYTTTTITNVTEGEHIYIVKSVSTRFGESNDGSQLSIKLIYPTMVAPDNLTYNIVKGNDITLKWDLVEYATQYKIYQLVNGEKVLKQTVSSTSGTLVNMPEGDYNFEVYSYSSRFGESQEGSSISFTLIHPTMQAPSGFAYSILNGNDIKLNWITESYATNYKVYQIINGGKVLKQTVSGTSVNFINMPEGDYNYEIHSYSDRFGESQESSKLTFTLIHPIMQAPDNFINSIINGNDITLKWDKSDYATAYNVYQIINGEKILNKTLTGTSVTFINMPEGEYNYEVYSYSNRFGESPIGSPVNFTLIWPVLQAPTLSGTVFNVNNMDFTWNNVTWANEYRVYEVFNDTKTLVYKGTAKNYKAFNLSEATHSFQVTAYSNRFGESTPSNLITENIIYPVMQSPAAALKLINGTTAQISWNFIIYANGYNVYEIIDDEPVLLVQNLNNLSYTISNLTYMNHQYFVTSYSNSFGESAPSNTVLAKLIVDTEAPVTSIDAPITWTNESPMLVTLSSIDDETGVAATYYAINDGGFREGNSFIISEEGIHKISFYSVDKVGNKETVKTINIKIDKTAPTTTVDLPQGWLKGDITINLSANDELSGIAKTLYSIDESSYVEATALTIIEEGVHKISFYSVDEAGNEETVKTVNIKIDKTAPTIEMREYEEYKLGSILPLTYIANDSLSGVAIEKMVVFEPNESIGKVVSNGTNLQLDKPGVYTVSITVEDAAGNSTTIQKQFVVYIQANIEVTAKVIKGNNGVFTVRVDLPSGYSTEALDLDTATVNGVNALTSNKGYYNQAKIGQFKFERSDFNWTAPEQVIEFRCFANGYLFVGTTDRKSVV